MTTMVMLVAMAALIGGCAVLGLRLLRHAWGLDEHESVTGQVLRMLVPRPDRGATAVFRALLRQLLAMRFVSATGEPAAFGVIRCVTAPATDTQLRGFYGGELEVALAARYEREAERRGWRLPTDGVRVLLEVDERLQVGWVDVVGTPTSLRPSGRANSGGDTRLLGDDHTAAGDVATVQAETIAERTAAAADVIQATFEPVGGGAPVKLSLVSGMTVIAGRSSRCGFVVDTPLVSRRHATLRVDTSGQLVVEDAGSSNGLLVDGVRCDRSSLVDGSFVTFGTGGPSFRVAVTSIADLTG